MVLCEIFSLSSDSRSRLFHGMGTIKLAVASYTEIQQMADSQEDLPW